MDEAARLRHVQNGFAHLSAIVHVVVDLLELLKECLPVSETEEAELEGLVPYSVSTDLGGTIECVTDDHLTPAIAMLRKSADMTAELLADDWRQKRRGAGPGSSSTSN